MKSFKQFIAMAGLPRAGSTLLSSILSQNPEIHAEGNSGLCHIMSKMRIVCEKEVQEQSQANGKTNLVTDMLSGIPHLYYRDIPESIVIDKCRGWTFSDLYPLLFYIDKKVKVIILERSITEVVLSFAHLFKENNLSTDEINTRLINMISPNTQPIMTSINGIIWAKNNNSENNFLFISYNDLVNNTELTIQKIYSFCEWKYFSHNFDEIKTKYKENDEAYNLNGMHDVRSKIGKRNLNDNILPIEIKNHCEMIDKMMGYSSD